MEENENKKLFSKSLKYYMLINDKSRLELAKDLKISYTTICDWVNGNNIPRSKKIELIANYFGVEVADMYKAHTFDLDTPLDDSLHGAINKYSQNKYQKELLIKASMLNLDNTKLAIKNVDQYLDQQDLEDNTFKYKDNL